jgi:hypothetical protein
VATARTTYDNSEERRLARTRPYVRALERGAADQILTMAKKAAPVSEHGSHGRPPGYLRSKIVKREKLLRDGIVIDVMTFARAPDRFPYGLFHQRRRPYIRPLAR